MSLLTTQNLQNPQNRAYRENCLLIPPIRDSAQVNPQNPNLMPTLKWDIQNGITGTQNFPKSKLDGGNGLIVILSKVCFLNKNFPIFFNLVYEKPNIYIILYKYYAPSAVNRPLILWFCSPGFDSRESGAVFVKCIVDVHLFLIRPILRGRCTVRQLYIMSVAVVVRPALALVECAWELFIWLCRQHYWCSW